MCRKNISIPPKDIAIPSVVIYELEFGIAKSSSPKKRQAQLNDILIAGTAGSSGNIGHK